jgi:heme a synthase
LSVSNPVFPSVAPAEKAGENALAGVRRWLWFVTGLVVLMVLVGGATRLTGSGLSITEWRPLTGALPPLSEAAWQAEFAKYRAIPQYELMNKGMTLSAFKVIFWWEWGHRQLGRFVGLAYMLPLLWFVTRGVVRGKLAVWLLAVGALGGFQAAIGWVMVASGLQPGMTAVAPIKLALHLTVACLILTCLVWTARALRPITSEPLRTTAIGSRSAALLVGLLLLQIALGALVAGSKSGLTYNTWPLMDGAFVPGLGKLFVMSPWMANIVENPTLVQFNHRMTAYLLLGFAIWHALRLRRAGHDGAKGALHIAAALTCQAGVGIATLLLNVPLWTALTHQVFAALILIVMVMHAERMWRSRQGI